MKHDIKWYVNECSQCQQFKTSSLIPVGLLHPSPILHKVWEDISMDFVEGLLMSHGIDLVLIVVDRFNKYAQFIILKHHFSMKDVTD